MTEDGSTAQDRCQEPAQATVPSGPTARDEPHVTADVFWNTEKLPSTHSHTVSAQGEGSGATTLLISVHRGHVPGVLLEPWLHMLPGLADRQWLGWPRPVTLTARGAVAQAAPSLACTGLSTASEAWASAEPAKCPHRHSRQPSLLTVLQEMGLAGKRASLCLRPQHLPTQCPRAGDGGGGPSWMSGDTPSGLAVFWP